MTTSSGRRTKPVVFKKWVVELEGIKLIARHTVTANWSLDEHMTADHHSARLHRPDLRAALTIRKPLSRGLRDLGLCSSRLTGMPLMPRYHFHFASRGGEQVADPEGVELDDLRAAHRHAMKLIRRTALFTSRRWNAREWSVQVVDGDRRW